MSQAGSRNLFPQTEHNGFVRKSEAPFDAWAPRIVHEFQRPPSNMEATVAKCPLDPSPTSKYEMNDLPGAQCVPSCESNCDQLYITEPSIRISPTVSGGAMPLVCWRLLSVLGDVQSMLVEATQFTSLVAGFAHRATRISDCLGDWCQRQVCTVVSIDAAVSTTASGASCVFAVAALAALQTSTRMKASHTITRGCCCSRDQRDTHIQVQSSSVWECSLRATRIGECCEHLFPITSRKGGGDRPNSLSNNTHRRHHAHKSQDYSPLLVATVGPCRAFFLVLNLRRTHKAQFTTSSQVGGL